MKGVVLIDANSIGFAAQASPKLSSGDMETQAIFGFIKSLRVILTKFPGWKPILLWDGRSWRYSVFEGYKAKRSEDPKMVALKDAYKAQKPWIARAAKVLGIDQVMALNYEADDLAGVMTDQYRRRGDKVILISGDKDWLQLVGPGVLWFDPIRDNTVHIRNFEEATGYPNARTFVQGKALVGDNSDCIPGVGGIGKTTAPVLLREFGSVESYFEKANSEGFELPESLSKCRKKLAAFAEPEGQKKFAFNMQLMDLRFTGRPKAEKLTANKGALNTAAFKALCEDLSFHSILKFYSDWLSPFVALAEERKAA